MWVSTTGEDSPQCIYDTAPSPLHLNESCGTLNYALTNIQNDTIIVILCGIHELTPLGSPDSTPLSNIRNVSISGYCSSRLPRIHCTNGTRLAFFNVQKVGIANVAFEKCGEQLQNSDSLLDSSTLFFQDCEAIKIVNINIIITGPYGRGISVIRYDTAITQRDILMESISIYHFGFHGSGIHCEVALGRTSDASLPSDKLQLIQHNIQVFNVNVHPIYDLRLNRAFTGINITLKGDGEGGELALHNVTVMINTRGSGILIALSERVSRCEVHIVRLKLVREEISIGDHPLSNMTDSITYFKYLSNTSETASKNSTAHSSFNIVLKGNSTGNNIKIREVSVADRGGITPGSALSIDINGQSVGNAILLHKVYLVGSNRSRTHRRGLQVILTGWARNTVILIKDLQSFFYRTYWGGGAYIEFSGNVKGNLVVLNNTRFHGSLAFRGGGIAVLCKDFAIQNVFEIKNGWIQDNFAEFGGGFYLILQDSSRNNTALLKKMVYFNNKAHCGGGMFIRFQNRTVANKVEILGDLDYNADTVTKSHSGKSLSCAMMKNTLLPSEKFNMMGGGVHVDFSTVGATFRTDNIVSFMLCGILQNRAEEGVGGGISVLYKHSCYQGDSGDRVILDTVVLFSNKAVSGSECSFQSLPLHSKRIFKGIRIMNTMAQATPSGFVEKALADLLTLQYVGQYDTYYREMLMDVSYERIQEQSSQAINPSFQLETNTNMVYAKSVQVAVHNLTLICGASAQGIYALDSEIVLAKDAKSYFSFCVAAHGGAIALYGESYIRVCENTGLVLASHHAFQRGGAIYASSAPGGVPVSDCFLQYDQGVNNTGSFVFVKNSAKAEGQSVYVSDVQNCLSDRKGKNVTKNISEFSEVFTLSQFDIKHFNFTYVYDKDQSNCCNTSWTRTMQNEVMSGPKHVTGANVDPDKPLTAHLIPGEQKRLPYSRAYDEFGNNISSVFSVLINKMDGSLPVELDPFSKYTDDFTVILHGIPQQHGMANHSFPSNTSNTSAVVRPPQLVLQSVDNTDLLLVMNIELQCCPPGYIFRYGSGDMGTCHCGVLSVLGIAECNESHSKMIGAILKRDHWAGYLPSNDQHSCDGQKFFTGPCPPGYCQTQQIILPQNNSKQGLQDVVCAGSDRKGLLCGECIERKGIAVNFNGIRPVCISCEEGLSNVGVLIWILSEWVPMLAFMFILMLFNIDLVSGRFNSFLLFAQLLALSTIRGDAELGPVHNAFVRIYQFVYGMWNLDFFGVLLPPYCLAPNANLTLLQTLLLHYSIGLFPLTVAITLTVLERSAEKWICCHRVDQCLRRMRRWKAKYSDGMSYDRALPAFVILGFTRFLVSSTYILVHHTITGEDGERKVVVWWQGSVPYGSMQHIAYFIPAIVILLVFVLLPSFLLLTLPIVPQLFGRLIIAVPPLRKLQRIQTFCSNVYTDRWVYHFINVFQGCYKERFRSFSSLYLIHRIIHLLVAVFIPRAEDALRIQIFLVVALLLFIATLQPYNSRELNTLDAAILGNLALILILSLHITDLNTPIGTRQFYASIQMILTYLPILYPGILLGRKVYLKCRQLRCCQKQEEPREDNAEPLLEAPAERLGNLVLITELRAGVPTSEDDDTVTETETET